jgi:hypothetical protein
VTCIRTSRRAFSVSSGRVKRLHAAHKKARRKVRSANIEDLGKLLLADGRRGLGDGLILLTAAAD